MTSRVATKPRPRAASRRVNSAAAVLASTTTTGCGPMLPTSWPADAAGGEGMPLHSQRLLCDKNASRLARAWVRELSHGVGSPDSLWRDGIVHDLVLCASELVNLSLIAHSTAIGLRLLVEPDVFRLSLVDDCPILTESADPAFHAQSMCLRVIEACSESFGIAEAAPGRELWVRFTAASPRVAAQSRLGTLIGLSAPSAADPDVCTLGVK